MAATKSTRRPAKGRASTSAGTVRRWSQDVTGRSNALDLEPHLFASDSPEEIAASLKRSALSSRRRKGMAFQSAMSMLNFYINRAGRNLPRERRATLEQAKGKLREAFGRPP
ncbi:DUF3175 domain-containing protein [Cupriavidus sp. CuC1]|uniref:DUF3175 domain-containing protein n=1 Tax=Cupriavidus sp. CuC1 TaxID=3373131 RepID=UPI0037D70D0A